MANLTKSNRVNYYNKDFSKIREDLINYSKTYFPMAGNDFSPASPGMMFIEMASYVGDLLSFYLDRQIQETFIQTAVERENIIQNASMLGYSHKNITPASTTLSIFQLVPALNGASPNLDYALTITANSSVTSNDGSNISFRTLADVNFKLTSSIDSEVDVYSLDLNGAPEYYLLKRKVAASAGSLETETFTFPSDTPPNPTIKIGRPDVIEIFDVVDDLGNTWYEVPYLAQQTVLQYNKNDIYSNSVFSSYESDTPYLLNYILTNKKFIKRVNTDNTVSLLFGSGVAVNSDNVLFPNQEMVNSGFTPSNINNRMLDPTNFLYFGANGEVPRNVTLTVRYYAGGGFESNVGQGVLTNIQTILFGKINDTILSPSLLQFVKNSITVTNEYPAQGGRGEESDEEIRNNAIAFFNAQNRCVTAQDYMIRSLCLPQKLGSIAKVYAVRDEQIYSTYVPTQPPPGGGRAIDTEIGNASIDVPVVTPIENPLAINLYCLSYDSKKNFVALNAASKQNLSKYLGLYRMTSDALNIKDAYIINIGVKFEIVVLKNYNQNEVLLRCILALKNALSNDVMQINKPIILSELYSIISLVSGVQSTKNVEIVGKVGGSYSNHTYIGGLASAMKSGVLYPAADASIFEVKFPDVDISGIAVNY